MSVIAQLGGAVLAAPQAPGTGSPISVSLWVWGAFVAFVVALLLIDLKVVMREPHEVGTKEAAIYSAVWISLGLLFTFVVWFAFGATNAAEYITGYLIEKSLSMDNVFVWAVLFSYFSVPGRYQHRVLFWGIFGALVLRALFIFGGVALLRTVHWVIYVFGAFLLFTAWRIATSDDIGVDPERNRVLQLVRRVIPHTDDYREEQFFVKEDGRRLATPLLTVLVAIELTDVLFAVDSIPAILAITRDEFLVFSSNAFAILGLRALYFLLADLKDRFVHLDKGLGIILGFVGVKFLISELWHIPIWLSLTVIAVVLTASIWLSLRHAPEQEDGDGDDEEAAGEAEREEAARGE